MRADHERKVSASTKRDAVFLAKRFTYWNKHQSSQCHWEANKSLILIAKQICGDVGELHTEEQGASTGEGDQWKMLLKVLRQISRSSRLADG